MQLSGMDIARFWRRVDKSAGHTGCWPWKLNSGKQEIGYGSFTPSKQKTVRATHVALVLAGKPRPSDDFMGCHTCDWPPCVQPLHLFWGTSEDNAKDASNKGRLGCRQWTVYPVHAMHCERGHELSRGKFYLFQDSKLCRVCVEI